MCEKGLHETVGRLMLECERYEYAGSKMLEVVVEEIGVQEWSEMRERSASSQMEYLLGLSAKWRSNSRTIVMWRRKCARQQKPYDSRVLECERVLRQDMENKNERK